MWLFPCWLLATVFTFQEMTQNTLEDDGFGPEVVLLLDTRRRPVER